MIYRVQRTWTRILVYSVRDEMDERWLLVASMLMLMLMLIR